MASSSSSSAAVVAEGSAARRFWIAASTREAAFASYTPFLLSVAAGNLRLDSFRHYIAQDAHFLHAFARAYEMAEECAADDDERATIAALRKAVLQELNLHASVLQDNALQIEELLDKLSVSLTGEELEVIGKLYQQAMRLEVEFFSAQPVDQPVVAPLSRYCDPKYKLLVFSDFDLTCTSVDSSAILAEIAILSHQKASQSGTDNTLNHTKSADLRNSWNIISKQYMEEYEQCMERLLPPDEARSLDYDQLYKGLEVLAEFEKLANSRVVDSGVLRGMNLEDIRKAGERLILQDGCRDFFQKIGKTREGLNLDIHVLSYCWCAELIRSAFSSVGCLDGLNIHSNEFAFEGSVSTGQIERKMQSPIDKVEKLKSIKSDTDSTSPLLSVYIGDSVGDLLCLLEADIGIVVGSSTTLRRVGKQFGVSFVPLFPGLVDKQRQLTEQEASMFKVRSGVLYTVSSWSEIHAFILGNDFS
ncbi:bifunctional TH2 protein, mitochondrial-like isoform X3 [Phragmites australis]|uniref:bifunctional TH2 protein, mitochondrial-like isoform X3 n=1 Tax=Phragmites australis TaxID=29695 RepID=UPI002D77E9D7|nr:bifunctional TH2 protein, mitochondrial-like isoform X3 [Phragmites australis]